MMLGAVLMYFQRHPRHLMVIAVLAVVSAVALGLYFKGRYDADAKNEAVHRVAVADAKARDEKADTKSVDVVAQQAEVAAAKQEELIDAVAKAPDTLSDESSVRWGCSLMRQQGRRLSDVPACRAVGF